MQASRIDRFLISSEWNENFKVIKQVALPRVISDHRPLLMKCGDWEVKPSYFKFENMWLQAEGFMDKVEEWWHNYTLGGSPDFILTQKLKKLKKDITDWNKATFGQLETRKSQILEDLALLETIAESRLMSQAEKEKLVTLNHELQKLAIAKEVSWRQKSRCLWLKEGDKNTKFFHTIANSNRRNNCIDKLLIDGEISEESEEIKTEILSFYQDMYTENENWRRPRVTFDGLASISLIEKAWLERPFEEEEV